MRVRIYMVFKIINKLILLVFVNLTIGCSNDRSFTFCSSDGTECFTVKNNGNIRVIRNGNTKVKDSGYIKLDLSKVDRTVGDQVVGCWNKNNKKWEIRMDNVAILKNKLDTTQYVFVHHFPYDHSASVKIPNTKEFNGANCFSIGFEYNEIIHIWGDVRLVKIFEQISL